MDWDVYLAGEIHTNWREDIAEGVEDLSLPVTLHSPVTDHEASDACGTEILGEEENPFWKDRLGAGINSIRTRHLITQADLVVVKFGEEYRQWNAAFDAGFAAAQGTPLVVLHPSDLHHALKEVDAAAMAVAETTDQVVEILEYITTQR